MSLKEFQRLRAFSECSKIHSTHMPFRKGKRNIKNRGKAVGQILKSSRIEYQIREH